MIKGLTMSLCTYNCNCHFCFLEINSSWYSWKSFYGYLHPYTVSLTFSLTLHDHTCWLCNYPYSWNILKYWNKGHKDNSVLPFCFTMYKIIILHEQNHKIFASYSNGQSNLHYSSDTAQKKIRLQKSNAWDIFIDSLTCNTWLYTIIIYQKRKNENSHHYYYF